MSDAPAVPDYRAEYADLGTSTLIEVLGRFQRYEDRFVKMHGREGYDGRVRAMRELLEAREVDPAAAVPAPEKVVRPPCRITPLADYVVVLPAEAATMTAGGLHVPESAKEKPQQGDVLAIGPGKPTPTGSLLMAVAVGDTVLFGRYAGTELVLDDERVLVMREEDIIGKLAPKVTP